MPEAGSAWKLDYGNMLSQAVGGTGLDAADIEGRYQSRHEAALAEMARRREAGDLGFLELPYASEAAAGVQELADGFGQWFRTVVVLGIGGSALGARTLRDALRGPLWNELDDEARDDFPRLYVLDNPDPRSVSDLLERVDLRTTLFNVVSKSGATAETAALYLVARQRMSEALDDPEAVRGHFLFTTDPREGVLRRLAAEEGVVTLPVPGNVGGRFSVLSSVGLLPAAVLGLDLPALLRGAARMEERCRAVRLADNPAGLLATLLHAADTERDLPIHVLMPYSDRLRSFGLWFQQLWAESLGKPGPDGTGVGPTPLPAIGATDQHAQVQLFMEGPIDKAVVFVAVHDHGTDVMIPSLHPEVEALRYLGGSSLAELIDAERRATTEALRRRGMPSFTIEIARLNEEALGSLLMLFEIATVLAGALYGVDPMNQPGVELGKHLTYGLMGRPGFEPPTEPPARSAFVVEAR